MYIHIQHHCTHISNIKGQGVYRNTSVRGIVFWLFKFPTHPRFFHLLLHCKQVRIHCKASEDLNLKESSLTLDK